MKTLLKAIIRPWSPFGYFGIMVALVSILACGDTLKREVAGVHDGVAISQFHVLGRDFVNVWMGGRLASDEGASAVYDRDHYRQRLNGALGIRGIYAYSYPPHMLLASIPFGTLPYWAALFTWTVLTTGLFWHAALPFLKGAGLPGWSVLILPAYWVNLWAGHFGCLVGALALYGWHFAATKPRLSGAAFALMTVKPHFGVFIPIFLAARGKWKVMFWAALFAFLFVGASLFIFGPSAWKAWLTSTVPFQSSLIGVDNPNLVYLRMMPTVERMAAALGIAGLAKTLVQLAFAAAAVLLLVKPWRDGVALSDLGLLSIVAVFLVLPYAFNYDMVAYCLAILVLAARFKERLTHWRRGLVALAFVVPAVHPYLAKWGWPLSAIVILAALAILSRAAAIGVSLETSFAAPKAGAGNASERAAG